MPLTITQQGKEISTEKLVLTVVSDDPLVTSVVGQYYYKNNQNPVVTLEHLPDFGTISTFSFEINSVIKDYFASEFLPLSGANQTIIENTAFGFAFSEYRGASPQPGGYLYNAVVKNITQDTFEIEDFDLADYDCGNSGSSSSKLLTSSPSPLPIGDLTSIHVSCLSTSYTGGVTPDQEWFIQTLLNGVLVATTNEAINVPTRFLVPFLPAGKYDISTYRYDFDSSTGIDEVRFYVRDVASPFTIRSETKTYKLKEACEKTITLSWLNELGTQDSFTFAGNLTRTGKYTDKTYKKVRPVAPLSTNVGDIVYKSNYNYEYDIFSDRMPEKQVQWLSKILINKRAAIQESPSKKQTASYLYNFFTLNGGVVGDGRVAGGIVNASLTGWIVPQQTDFDTLIAFLGGTFVAGGAMKQAGFINWDSPNTGATNSSGFNGLPDGFRSSGGVYAGARQVFQCWSGDVGGGGETSIQLQNSTAAINKSGATSNNGLSVRLMRPAVGGEVSGQIISNAYIGNDGKNYDGVVIGTQVWINKDLHETRYNDSSSIPNVEDNTAWSVLATGGFGYSVKPLVISKGEKYFPITITSEETTLEDKFTPETIFRLKFRLANERKGLK